MRFFLVAVLFTLLVLPSACNMAIPLEQGNEGMTMDDGMAMDEESDMDMSGGSMAADSIEAETSENGLFVVRVVSRLDPVVINETHSWLIHIETPDESPVLDAELSIEGGMPAHNHGFPTAPRVTENLGGGDYLLEGVRFNMGGVWVLTLEIRSGEQTDSVTFEFELN